MDVFEKNKTIMSYKDNEIREYVQEYMKMNFIYESFCVSGSSIKKSDILNIMRGNIVKKATIYEHQKIEKFIETFKYMDKLLEMDIELTSRYLMEFMAKLNGDIKMKYRKINPTIREYGYTPPHFLEIENEMSKFDRWIVSDKANKDFLVRLSEIYFKIFEIYPMESKEQNIDMANLAICYELKRNNVMISTMNMEMTEHSDMIKYAIKYNNTKVIETKIRETLEEKIEYIFQRLVL